MEISKMALEMAEDGSLDAEVYQAYIDIVGEEYAKQEDAEEAYQGEFKSDEEFAQNLAEEIGAINKDATWPNNCIDWEFAAKELMYDYSEESGHYFRNL